MKLSEFKGEEAFKVMGKVVRVLRGIFKDEKCLEIIKAKQSGWVLDFLDYSLSEQSAMWLELFCALNPDKKPNDVSTQDVLTFAYEFMNDEQLMSLFFSQSQVTQKTSIGSAMENTGV